MQKRDLKPGEWMSPEEFAEVVRLTPLVAVDLVVRSPDGRVLVGRRVNEPAKGVFFVPGGRITKNETKAAAFRRISKEELGTAIDITGAKLLGAYEHFYPTNRFGIPSIGTHYLTLAYEVSAAFDLKALPTDQHGEYAWMSAGELLRHAEVHENTKAYFKQAADDGPNT